MISRRKCSLWLQPPAMIEKFSLVSLSHVSSPSLTIGVKPYFGVQYRLD